jgi:hypothetical protein
VIRGDVTAQQREDGSFELKAAKFLTEVPGEKAQALMEALRGDRGAWILKLIAIRDRIVHDISCPQLKMHYRLEGRTVAAVFPTVDHQDDEVASWRRPEAFEQAMLVCGWAPCRRW